jgi:porphobilinogen synthase
VSPGDLIYPIFVREGATEPEPIESMPGIDRLPVSALAEEAKQIAAREIGAVLLFGLPTVKDETGSASRNPDGVVQDAIKAIKDAAPDLIVMTDVCICAYTTHGHCGVLCGKQIDNDATLPLLAQMALSHAEVGADVVAPSSMMDEQVLALRQALDSSQFSSTAVMGYSSKFASAFYGPFREAADSAPSFGDRASYQHDFANLRHARREIRQDEVEGADILMVKPGLAYLDIVAEARRISDLPIAAYSVSGEYSMIKAAAERGWLDERKIVLETLTAFRRAGADLIITYFAKDASTWLNES